MAKPTHVLLPVATLALVRDALRMSAEHDCVTPRVPGDLMEALHALEANAVLVDDHEPDRAQRDTLNGAYSERNRLVAAISRLMPASLEANPDPVERESGWRWLVFITLPTGQATWHIPDAEAGWFDHLGKAGAVWDGHTTAEKYERLDAAWT